MQSEQSPLSNGARRIAARHAKISSSEIVGLSEQSESHRTWGTLVVFGYWQTRASSPGALTEIQGPEICALASSTASSCTNSSSARR
jgi:hypothetical protein